jgi:hypothetical protein
MSDQETIELCQNLAQLYYEYLEVWENEKSDEPTFSDFMDYVLIRAQLLKDGDDLELDDGTIIAE